MKTGMASCVGVSAVVAMFILTSLPSAAGEWNLVEGFKEGRWRTEVQGFGAVYSGKTEREGDQYVMASVEYEYPIHARATLGLRLYPLFYYDHHKDRDSIYGSAIGLAGRVYQNPEELNGWYGEVGAGALWQSRYFTENNSRVNFLLEAGVGYQFESGWHLAFKYSHMSNSSMGTENAGVNGLGLAAGYTF